MTKKSTAGHNTPKTDAGLRQGEEWHRLVAESTSDFVVVSTVDGIVVYASPSFTRLGYKPNELAGKFGFDFVHPDDIRHLAPLAKKYTAKSLPRLLGRKRTVSEFIRYRFRDASGQWRDMETTVNWVKGVHEDEFNVVAVSRDVTDRKQAEEALMESEGKFRSLAEHSPNMVFINKNGRVVYVNEKCEQLMGYGREEFYSPDFDFLTLIAPECRDLVTANLGRHMKEKEIPPYEYTLLSKGGERIEAILTTVLMRYEGETAILGTVTDITERKQAEEALRRSEEYHRSLLENAMEAIAIVNSDGTVQYESPSYKHVLGRNPVDQVGVNSFDLIHPDDLSRVTEVFTELLQNPGGTVQAEVRSLHDDGSYRTLEVMGRNLLDDPLVGGIIANFRDITERKQAEEELQSQREWFQSLIENSLDAVVVLNGDGTPRYVSSSAQRVLGYEPGELGDRNPVENVHPDDLQTAMEAFAGLLEGSSRTLHTEIRSQHKDGSWRTLEVVGRNLMNDPKVDGIICNYRDITERKQTEEALRQSEQEHSLLVGNLADAVFRYRDGAITWANDRIKEMLGYTNEELVGADVNLFLTDKSSFSEMYIAANAGLKQQSHFHGTTRAKRKDGSIADIEFTASLVPGKVPFEIVGIARDITERKRMEEALLIKNNAIEKSITAMAISDVQGTITYVNEACLRLWRIASREGVLGQSFWALLQLDDQAVGKEVASSMIENGSWQGELSCWRRDGERIDVQVLTAMIYDRQGKPIQTITSFIDITERKKAEETLRIKENAIENSVDAIVMTDMEGRLTYVNQACLKVWGSSRKEDLLGEPYSSLLKSEEVAAEIAAAMSENLVWQGELAATRKDGKEVHVEVSASLVIDDQGNPIQTISSARDVTEAKRAEVEKRTMEQQLLLSGRLAAVGELAAGVAHELNNPIAAVQAYAQFLSSREGLDESTKSDVETIYKEAKRASKITANLLSFARKHEPEKTIISINKVVEESLELHAYRMKVNNLEVSRELAPDLPNTMADFHQLQQVFMNLITNAEQAMTEARGKGRLSVTTQRAGDAIRITFTDNGPGIDEENLKRLFDPFYTTKAVGKGTGLGLSICYGIVQEHGGQLYARSRPGHGATFTVEIPIVREDEDAERVDSIQDKHL